MITSSPKREMLFGKIWSVEHFHYLLDGYSIGENLYELLFDSTYTAACKWNRQSYKTTLVEQLRVVWRDSMVPVCQKIQNFKVLDNHE